MSIVEVDSYGRLDRYDKRRKTHPHSARKSRAVREGNTLVAFNSKDDRVLFLPKRADACPCGKVIETKALDDGSTAHFRLPYKNCCEGKFWETFSEDE